MSDLSIVYGVSLDMLMNNREKGRDIPIIFEKIVNWIIKNGIIITYRIYIRALPPVSLFQ